MRRKESLHNARENNGILIVALLMLGLQDELRRMNSKKNRPSEFGITMVEEN